MLKLITYPIRLLLSIVMLLATVAYVLAGVGQFEPWKPRPAGRLTAAPEGAGWEDLLSAENALKWKDLAGTQSFEVRNGTLHIPGSPHPFVSLKYATFTGKDFADFDLHLEFKLGEPLWWSMIPYAILSPQMHGNSGVFLHVPKDESALRGFEVQVVGDYGWPACKTGTGAIYDVVTPMFNMARPVGEWNSYDISTRGTKVTVTVNGWRVIETDFAQLTAPVGKFSTPYAQLPLEGRIALQDHGSEITYRNIRVRAANATDLVPVSRDAAPAGATPAPSVPAATDQQMPASTVTTTAPAVPPETAAGEQTQ